MMPALPISLPPSPFLAALALLLAGALPADAQVVLHAAPEGRPEAAGTEEDPLSFSAGIERMSRRLREDGLPLGGLRLVVHGGRYPIERPLTLGGEFLGTEDSPIEIRAAEGERVVFDGGIPIPPEAFAPVSDPIERARLAASAADRILVADVSDPRIAAALSRRVVTTLSIGTRACLPAVFPNEGWAGLAPDLAVPEVSPPAVPPGAADYGVRAGHPPYQEEGRPLGWRGTPDEPRGGWARLGARADERAGTWRQWQAEIARDPRRVVLVGYVSANWLHETIELVAADAEREAVRLAKVLAYGWDWKKADKPCRIYGLLCELDRPGEWYFDPHTKRLFVYPFEGEAPRVSVAAGDGFLVLHGTRFVRTVGLDVENLGEGYAFRVEGGDHALIAGATVRNGSGGVSLSGTDHRVQSCDFVDLESHCRLAGGRRGPGLLEAGRNTVENCRFWQRGFTHRGVNVSISGVGNVLRNALVHASIGQAVTVRGNDHRIERCEFFDIGYEEGDGGAVYAGADLIGYGTTYRHNFFHHLMHVPGKVERSGIHLDDGQSGAICEGNVFFKSAGKGIFMNGGAGHVISDNVFLEGFRGAYNVGAGAARRLQWEQEIRADPNHRYRRTKENYLGRVEREIGERGWAREPWRSRYPTMFAVLEDTGRFGRHWPIRCRVTGNLYYGNTAGDRTIWDRVDPEARAKSVIEGDRVIGPEVFVDYDALDLRFRPDVEGLPAIPFERIGLYLDAYRARIPDPRAYRRALRELFEGIPSMPGTRKRLDTARLLDEGPWIDHDPFGDPEASR